MDRGLIRVRDFAKQNGCTPQNIYKHLRTYAEQLDGHTFQGPGRKGVLLDDFAQDFLRGVMYPKEVAADDTITRLQSELEQLRSAHFVAMQEATKQASRIMQLEADNEKMNFELSANLKALAASNEEREAQAAELQRAKEVRSQAEEALEQMRLEATQRLHEAEAAEEREMQARVEAAQRLQEAAEAEERERVALEAKKAAEAALEATEAINREQAAELDRLRKRGLWARIRNK